MPPPQPGYFEFTEGQYTFDGAPGASSSSANNTSNTNNGGSGRRKARTGGGGASHRHEVTGGAFMELNGPNGGNGVMNVEYGSPYGAGYGGNGGGGSGVVGMHDRVKIIRGNAGVSTPSNGLNNPSSSNVNGGAGGSGTRYGSAAPPEEPASSSRRGGASGSANNANANANAAANGNDPNAVASAKRKRETQEKISKYSRDQFDRRDEIYTNSLNALTQLAHNLHQSAAETPAYALRLYPFTVERGALLNAISYDEQHMLNSTEMLFNSEMKQIEDEFEKGRARLRERIMEGIEERRRRAREEKEGEGVVPSDSTSEITANALKGSTSTSAPPPFTLASSIPYGLSPDDLFSPFPLSLTSIQPLHSSSSHSGPGRKPRTGGGRGGWGKDSHYYGNLSLQALLNGGSATGAENRGGGGGGIGANLSGFLKSAGAIAPCREGEIDHDLGEIRRAMKRRRAAVKAAGGSL